MGLKLSCSYRFPVGHENLGGDNLSEFFVPLWQPLDAWRVLQNGTFGEASCGGVCRSEINAVKVRKASSGYVVGEVAKKVNVSCK